MAFVNEYVSDEDVKKYGLEEICDQYRITRVRFDWTIDRDRDIYLMWIASGREEFCDEEEFIFFWKGTLIFVETKSKGEAVRGGKGWTNWTLRRLSLPEQLKDKRSDILEDLKEALSAYQTFGISSTVTEHTATFEF